MSFVPYDDGTASDVEYTEVNFDELTSCYTYNPLFTAIKSQSKTVKDENNFIQWISPNEEIHFEKSTNDGYLDIIWIYGKPTFNIGSGSKEGTKIVGENEKINVITKMDLKNYRYVVNQFFTTLTDDDSIYTKYTRDGQTYTQLEENEKIHGGAYYWLNITNDKAISDIYPVIRYVDTNGEKMLFYPHLITELNTFRNTQTTGIIVNTKGVAENTDNVIYFMMHDIGKSYNYPRLDHQFNVGGDNDITYIWYNETQVNTQLYPTLSYEKFKEVLALLGVYFRIGGVDYLGYMDSSGQTTGEYLTEENWNKSSQYNSDTINNFTQHEPPYTPPPEDDESDDINFGGSYAGLGAFAKFYLCSGLEISQLNSWINGRSPDWPENFDPMTQIISISRFATDLSSASYGSTTIKFHTTAGTEIDTKIAALHGNGDNIELDLGSVNIPLRMKERGIPFLDYESTIELYIPACGTFILDPQTVLGSTLSVKMWLSTSTGECNSIAYVVRNGVKAPVAYGSGSLAVPMPVTSIGWGSYLAQVTNANIKYYFGGLNGLTPQIQMWGGAIMGNEFGTASGLSGLVSPFQNIAQAEQNIAHLKNSSFTSVSGSFGSTAAWNYPFNAYVKITRRHFKKPSNYAHTRGIPLVETKTLRDCLGFTICVNADVTSINATIQEKNMIVEALNNGVIV